MAVTFKGGTAATPVPPRSRILVTWRWTLADVLNPLAGLGFDAPGVAENIRDALPALGYIPATLPAAAPGDEVVVFTVSVGSQQPTRTLGDHAARLDTVPVTSLLGGKLVEVVSVELVSVYDAKTNTFSAPGGGAAPSAAQQQKQVGTTQTAAQQQAQGSNLLTNAENAVGNLWDKVKGPLGTVLLVAAIGGGIYLYTAYGKK